MGCAMSCVSGLRHGWRRFWDAIRCAHGFCHRLRPEAYTSSFLGIPSGMHAITNVTHKFATLWTDLGSGVCLAANGLLPPRYYNSFTSVQSCKQDCLSFSWCQGVSVSSTTCAIHTALGSSPGSPSGWTYTNYNGCGDSCPGPITHASG